MALICFLGLIFEIYRYSQIGNNLREEIFPRIYKYTPELLSEIENEVSVIFNVIPALNKATKPNNLTLHKMT